jgi:hypothetical protein
MNLASWRRPPKDLAHHNACVACNTSYQEQLQLATPPLIKKLTSEKHLENIWLKGLKNIHVKNIHLKNEIFEKKTQPRSRTMLFGWGIKAKLVTTTCNEMASQHRVGFPFREERWHRIEMAQSSSNW